MAPSAGINMSASVLNTVLYSFNTRFKNQVRVAKKCTKIHMSLISLR